MPVISTTILVKLEDLKADRDTIQQALFEENIGTGIHYISAAPSSVLPERYQFKPDDFPNAVRFRAHYLPALSTKLTDEDVKDVIDAVKKY